MPTRRSGRPTKTRELWLAKDPFLMALQSACHLAEDATALPAAEHERQVEDTFLRAAVALEGFLSSWLARCVHFDTTRLAREAERLATQHASSEFGGRWKPDNQVVARALDSYGTSVHVTVTLPKTVSIGTARRLLGIDDSNRSFASAADFKEWVGRYVADDKGRAANRLSARDDAVLDATVAIRNVLAHRTRRAEVRMNDALRRGDLPRHLQVQQNVTAARVGRYLRVERGGAPRFRHYFEHLASIANSLAPYQGRPRAVCP